MPTSSATLDRAGRPRRTHYERGRVPANKGKRQEPNPPSGREVLRALERLGDSPQDRRLAALIAVLWRGGLGLTEALRLEEGDCDAEAGILIVRAPRKAARRHAVMDSWGFARLARWQDARKELPAGPLFCTLRGSTAGQRWANVSARAEVRRLGQQAKVPQLIPQQLRYAHAVELLIQGIPLAEIYRQLGLSTARNNRAPALIHLSGRQRASDVLRAPGAEKVLQRSSGMPSGEAYSLVRRAAQTADNAYREAHTRLAKGAWNEALTALHRAEDKIMQAVAEDASPGR